MASFGTTLAECLRKHPTVQKHLKRARIQVHKELWESDVFYIHGETDNQYGVSTRVQYEEENFLKQAVFWNELFVICDCGMSNTRKH